MKRTAFLLTLLVAGCSNNTMVTVPVFQIYEDQKLHEPTVVVAAALAKVELPAQAKVYRFGDGVAPAGTRLRYDEKDVFISSDTGTFVIVDFDPELDWAHHAEVFFIAERPSAEVVIVDGKTNTLMPGHYLIGPNREEFNSLWQELSIKRKPNHSADGPR